MAKKKAEQVKPAGVTASAGVAPKNIVEQLFDKYGVDTLYENSKGEFFTNYNLAIVSEGNVKDNVKTHNR